jgi:hypothetical protein
VFLADRISSPWKPQSGVRKSGLAQYYDGRRLLWPNNAAVSFGDNVRVRSTPLTERLGFANLVGSVFGETTASVTGVEVIGDSEGNRAINVFFEDRKKGFWFAPELLEFVDHAPGAEIRLDGFRKSGSGQRRATGRRLTPSGRSQKRQLGGNSGAKFKVAHYRLFRPLDNRQAVH